LECGIGFCQSNLIFILMDAAFTAAHAVRLGLHAAELSRVSDDCVGSVVCEVAIYSVLQANHHFTIVPY
jgi:hypothetical protein